GQAGLAGGGRMVTYAADRDQVYVLKLHLSGTQAVQVGGLPAGAVAGAVETFLADGDHRGVGDESGAAVVAEVEADDDGGVGGHQAAPRAGSASRSHSPVFPARSRCRAPSWQSWTVPPRWA